MFQLVSFKWRRSRLFSAGEQRKRSHLSMKRRGGFVLAGEASASHCYNRRRQFTFAAGRLPTRYLFTMLYYISVTLYSLIISETEPLRHFVHAIS